MHFPVGWDPYFRDHMTVQDVLHFPLVRDGVAAAAALTSTGIPATLSGC